MKLSLLPLAAAIAFTTSAYAEEATTLSEVVVTATRSAAINPILPTSSVITRSDIAERQPSSVTELLQQEAGINVISNGGPLTLNGVSIRGAASKQVLILIDGVRVNDANSGLFDISQLRPDDIERVEITRGPYSSQYGSDAIGGVIQIFTRKSTKAEASVRAGSFGTQEYNAGASLGDAKNGISIRGGYLTTDGFSATTPDNIYGNSDRDGGLAKTGMLSGQVELTEAVSAHFNTTWKDSSIEFDQGITDQRIGLADVELQHKVTNIWTQRLQLGWLRNDNNTLQSNKFQTERDSASWLHDVQWTKDWNLVAGIDFYDEGAISTDFFSGSTLFDSSLKNTGLFITQYGKAGIFSGSVSLRGDDHESFGSHTTGSANIAAQIAPQAKIFAAYGTAFRAPSANDLYYPGSEFFCFPYTPGVSCYAGNPDLQPEESEQSEVGAEIVLAGQRIRLSAYHNRLTNMISTSSAFPYPAINISNATLQGLELDISGKLERLNYSVNASQQSARDGTGVWLVQRPKASLNLTAGYAFTDSINAGAEVRSRSDSMSGGVELPGYALVNLYAGWQIIPALTLGARLENLGNKEYEVVSGYSNAERSGYLTATYSWH